MVGGDFHHDVILIQAFVDVGGLALPEGSAERVVNVLNGDAEAGGGVAVDDDGTLQAVELLVAVYVAELGDRAHAFLKNGSPVREVREVIGLESVLVLSATETAADAEILDGLQVQRGAGNLRRFRTNASDDLIDAELAFAERLELAEHTSGAAAATAAGERGNGCN